MKIGILTSSRADYGILKHLLKVIDADDYFHLELIVFGTHLLKEFGETSKDIVNDGFEIKHRIFTTYHGDSKKNIASSIGSIIKQFSEFWEANQNQFDLVLCLGDRYEMFAAITAAIPFNIKFAHFHGGETTLGAIDNFFRHSITLASTYHFVATKEYAKRVESITGKVENIFHIGALSIENIAETELYSLDELNQEFNININEETVLITVHPETLSPEFNIMHIKILFQALLETNTKALFSLPNADTYGLQIRKKILDFVVQNDGFSTIEHFGKKGYFSAMKHCAFLLGNTSSGIIEAASFHKFVINLGDRQKGRLTSSNVFSIPFVKEEIINTIRSVKGLGLYKGDNIYYKKGGLLEVVQILKSF